MKKKKWFLVITSILLMLLACTQIQAAAIKAQKILPAMQTKNFLQDITITKYVLIKP